MAGRPDPRSQEGYPSSSPSSSDPHDPFSNSQGEHVYYDNESDHVEYRRRDRDTYASDGSNHGYNDDGYYDNNGGYDPYGGEPVPSQRPFISRAHVLSAGQPDTDSEVDVYGHKYAPSAESLGAPRMGISESSTPTIFDGGPAGAREAYPAWSSERQIPLSKEEIEDIFLDLTQKFGFQRESMRNMVRRVVHRPCEKR